jgi:hypothetical protein
MAARVHQLLGAVVLILVSASTGARADAIDGQWCSIDGKHLDINGPRIRTPGGTQTQGDYDRHAFRYVVPAAEAGAGGTVNMRLLSDNVMHLTPPGSSNVQVWNRCGPPIS